MPKNHCGCPFEHCGCPSTHKSIEIDTHGCDGHGSRINKGKESTGWETCVVQVKHQTVGRRMYYNQETLLWGRVDAPSPRHFPQRARDAGKYDIVQTSPDHMRCHSKPELTISSGTGHWTTAAVLAGVEAVEAEKLWRRRFRPGVVGYGLLIYNNFGRTIIYRPEILK